MNRRFESTDEPKVDGHVLGATMLFEVLATSDTLGGTFERPEDI